MTVPEVVLSPCFSVLHLSGLLSSWEISCLIKGCVLSWGQAPLLYPLWDFSPQSLIQTWCFLVSLEIAVLPSASWSILLGSVCGLPVCKLQGT